MATRGGGDVSVYFLKPIIDEAAWMERKTQHGHERLFFPDKWPDIRFCSKHFHLSKHTHIHTRKHTH